MNILKTIVAASAVALFAQGANAAAIMIDDFDDFQQVSDGSPGVIAPTTSTIAAPSVLGGSRTLTVSTNPAQVPPEFGGSTLVSSGGVLTFNNQDGQQGVATVVYGVDAGGAALGDLTGVDGLNDRFFFEVLSGDLPGSFFSATVEDGAGMSDTVTELLVPGFSPFQLFSDFVGVDFTDVASLTFTLDSNGVDSFDGSIGSISAVPLPASGLLLLFGVGGVAAFGRRRRKEA